MIRDHEMSEPIERYELREGPTYRFELDRRTLVQILGAGIVLTTLRPRLEGAAALLDSSPVETVDQRVHIAPDGHITILTSKVEVGQGSRTQIAMAAAEELRVSLDRIDVLMADLPLVPDDGGTYGSRTTPSTIPSVRRGCAALRELLLETAAEAWSVDKSTLKVQDGRVLGNGQKAIGYGDLAGEEYRDALSREVPSDAELIPIAQWQVLGHGTSKRNGHDIVTGAHLYPSDIVRPGMLYGAILRPPSWTARLEAIDLGPAAEREGITPVRDGSFIGFTAKTSFDARRARDAVAETTQWTESPHVASDRLFEHLEETAREGGRRRRRGGGEQGSVRRGLEEAATRHEATYRVAYIQHAPMEPRAAVAEWQDGKLTVWTGTQAPSRVHRELAQTFRLREEAVRLIVPDTGGGFGGKHTAEVAVEAARLAKAAGHPVSLQWSREEEFQWAYFRPAGVIRMRGGLTADGGLIAWEQVNLNSGGSSIETPYEVPNHRAATMECDAPLRQGSYRGLAATANNFARECFMDELAAASNADPLAFRLEHLSHERLRPVLEEVAKAFDWNGRKERIADDEKRGIGIACGTEKGSYVATCAEIVVDEEGRYRIAQVCQAYECGKVQNPSGLKAQCEGALIQGLGGALMEEVRFENGRPLNGRFRDYPVPRIQHVPPIETVLMDRPDLPSVGAGETPIIGIAPAIANALFDATGERIRSMPIRSETLRPA